MDSQKEKRKGLLLSKRKELYEQLMKSLVTSCIRLLNYLIELQGSKGTIDDLIKVFEFLGIHNLNKDKLSAFINQTNSDYFRQDTSKLTKKEKRNLFRVCIEHLIKNTTVSKAIFNSLKVKSKNYLEKNQLEFNLKNLISQDDELNSRILKCLDDKFYEEEPSQSEKEDVLILKSLTDQTENYLIYNFDNFKNLDNFYPQYLKKKQSIVLSYNFKDEENKKSFFINQTIMFYILDFLLFIFLAYLFSKRYEFKYSYLHVKNHESRANATSLDLIAREFKKMKKIIFKYVKQFQKNTLIYPSEVNFLNEREFKIDDNLLRELNSKIDTLNKEQYPKLQIAQKNGVWFALNNTMLFLFQNLEQKKKVDKIYCEVISLDKVPEYLQKEMVLNFDYRTSESSDSCCSSCLNNTVTTIISNNRNKIFSKSRCCSESDDHFNEETYKTSLINENQLKNDELNLSLSSSSDLSDFNQRDLLSNYTLSCNYCNQTFSDSKSLRKHKLRKKHFACIICGEKFKNLTKLERHKQSLEHWTDDEP